MSFDYDKLKKKHESGEQWTSYSDLFMVLSVVFLLLYVVASLRTGTHTLQQQMQNQQLAEKAQDLENQIKAYNNLKEDYLEKEASKKESEMYEQLMDKLTLLQEKNNREARDLRRQAKENEQKEMALNKYQQLIRNIINSNMLSKAKIKRRDRQIASAQDTIENQRDEILMKDDTIIDRDSTIETKLQEIAELDEEVIRKKNIIAKKDSVIAEKQKILKQKQNQISKLNKDIKDKKKVIARNKRKIKKIEGNLSFQIKKLQSERKKRKISKKKYLAKMAALKKKSKAEIAKLDKRNKSIRYKLSKVDKEYKKASKQLSSANNEIKKQQAQKVQLDRQLAAVQDEVVKTKAEFEKSKQEFQAQISDLETQKGQLEMQKVSLESQRERLKRQKAKLEGQKNLLKSEKAELARLNSDLANVNSQLETDRSKLEAVKDQLSQERDKLAAEKSKLAAEKDKLEQQKGQLADVNKQLAGINAQLAKDKNKLSSARKQLQAERKRLMSEKSQLSGELKKAQEIINAKKKLANQIIKNFKKAGIKADVNEGTGEVVLAFGKSYFDSGSAFLKPSMKTALNKLMPIYADSIFKDPKTARKIKSIDIIGYSSPTYRGRYVNPNSNRPEDRKAMQYNTDLSMKRARSVFNHIIEKVNYKQQKKVQPLLKVSGRSYFSGALSGRAPAKEMSQKEFCSKYDCKKEQRVIIKFELD